MEDLLLRAGALDHTAGTPADPEEWFRAQSESLLRWAENTGRLLQSSELARLIGGFKILGGGLEHRVYFRKRRGRVFKITKPPYFGQKWYLADYIRNLVWSNALFEDDIQFEGVIESTDGVSIVISQPFIIGKSPSPEQIADWFTQQGCVSHGTNKWRYPGGSEISDAHTGNLILSRDGTLFPIDLYVDKLCPEDLVDSALRA